MGLNILLIFFLAHFIGDFIFQNESIINNRYNKDLKIMLIGNLKHTAIHFSALFLLSMYYISVKIFLIILLISLLHYFIDCMKSELIIKKPFWRNNIKVFSIDQILHFMVIILAAYLGTIKFINKRPVLISFENYFVSLKILHPVTISEVILMVLILLIISTWFMPIFIRIFLGYIQSKPYKLLINKRFILKNQNNDTGSKDGGFYIGILERLLIIISVVMSKPEMIGFVLATKSIARFKKFDDDAFVEKFIMGTFISFISAILIGIAFKYYIQFIILK